MHYTYINRFEPDSPFYLINDDNVLCFSKKFIYSDHNGLIIAHFDRFSMWKYW